MPDLTSSVEDVSSWTDNEDQEPDGEEDVGTSSSAIQGAVSVPLGSQAALLESYSPEDMVGRVRDKSLSGMKETRMGEDHSAFFFFLFWSESSRKICEGNAFHLRKKH